MQPYFSPLCEWIKAGNNDLYNQLIKCQVSWAATSMGVSCSLSSLMLSLWGMETSHLLTCLILLLASLLLLLLLRLLLPGILRLGAWGWLPRLLPG